MLKWLSITLLIIAIIAFLVMAISTVANTLFNQKIKKEVSLLFESNMKNKREIIEKEDLQGLPTPVQKWLQRSQIIGKEKITTVRLKQKGIMRIKENGPWMPAEAVQYFTVDEPAFIWKAKVNMAPFLYFAGMDKYKEGKGYMNIRILSLFSVVNARGPEMDQGTLLRYLGEMTWFPTAALSNYIKWDPIDLNSARATMSYKGVTASAVFTFNDNGDLVKFSAKRYRETNGKYVLEDWEVITKDYQEFQGIRIPNKMDVMWKLKTGDFTWYKVEITDMEYNNPTVY